MHPLFKWDWQHVFETLQVCCVHGSSLISCSLALVRRKSKHFGVIEHLTKPIQRNGKNIFEILKELRVVSGNGPDSQPVPNEDWRAPMWEKKSIFWETFTTYTCSWSSKVTRHSYFYLTTLCQCLIYPPLTIFYFLTVIFLISHVYSVSIGYSTLYPLIKASSMSSNHRGNQRGDPTHYRCAKNVMRINIFNPIHSICCSHWINLHRICAYVCRVSQFRSNVANSFKE